jgi:hypothetical protein
MGMPQFDYPYLVFVVVVVLVVLEFELRIARQAVFHLRAFFCVGYFQDRVS